MDHLHSTTNEHKKGQHLTYKNRVTIQLRLKDKWNANRIAKEIGCSANTVRNEIKRGLIPIYNGKKFRYDADYGQSVYDENRKRCCRNYKFLQVSEFIEYANKHISEDKWSLDACVGRALHHDSFCREQTLCVKTLYNYVNIGLLGIKNIDLPLKMRRSNKAVRSRENKRMFGRSIDERDKDIELREEFGHWESDLMIGSNRGGDKVLMTLAERKTRNFWMIPLPDKRKNTVLAAMKDLQIKFGDYFDKIFKTITTDNGSEFASLSDLEKWASTLVYFAHPYSAYEKGTVERHNGLIRRFIPKGKRIDSYSAEQIYQIELWGNNLPRKILGYKTPNEVFKEELDKIYGNAA